MKYFLMLILAVTTTVGYAGNAVYAEYKVVANTYLEPELDGLEAGEVWIRLVFHDTKDDLNDALDTETRARAWSKSGTTSDGVRRCVLHIVRPTDWNDKQILVDAGHEVMHCFGADH